MEEQKKINRNKFLKIIMGIAALPAGYLLFKFASNSASGEKQIIEATVDFQNGVLVKEEYILVKNQDKIKVFSSNCTHRRCQINTVRDNQIVCPCHGSRFDLDGNVIKGPATRNLDELPFTVKGNKINIEIEVMS